MLSKLVIALALLAFPFVLGASPSSAQEVAIVACPAPALDIAADVAEELDVLCQSQIEVNASDVADAGGPVALEGPAIRVEITQSVTIAVLGQDVEENDDVTGLLP